jgi:hypothetical protein
LYPFSAGTTVMSSSLVISLLLIGYEYFALITGDVNHILYVL